MNDNNKAKNKVTKVIKVAHISTGLETGGAEVQLLRLLTDIDKSKFEMIVISLHNETYLADRIRELGLPVHSLQLKKNPLNVRKAYSILKEFNPDVIHGTMYEGGVVGTLFNKFLPKKPPVIWTVHEPLEHYDKEPIRKRLQLRTWGLISKLPACMMYVSNLNKDQHVAWGFNNEKSIVIPNGVDTSKCFPNRPAGLKVRHSLMIPDNAFVIGKIARFHRQKNHIGFMHSAALLAKTQPHVHFMLVGTNVDENNEELVNLRKELGLEGKVHMLGNREDIPDVVNAFDLATLTSFGEAFPLTLGEAMVSGIPCVATAVGDNDYIIGDTGLITPIGDDEAMAEAWQKMVKIKRDTPDTYAQMGQAARQRTLDNFTLEQQVKQHEDLYRNLYNNNNASESDLIAES
ncbi:glycosyltransferase [Cocleimonas sp. KMM 6892]|uniref:glycosyltransferase n=1 Tax=unclassified Cocleimonas TaxID=2639732 RepID=UPI002DB9466A|nr:MULTISPECIES: glycosyltransferase [unclassified Cocleimonas]MEB8432429.1 glycosyltransferase [Cocleimonas sp. KMM 6892]MEC4715288.1 glycosyltransferase [Cocleimonas sp. KMM 6895]MEC4745093.1 glycosyltransferase [Cocleimonas sp. KMM 6896]